MSAQPWIKFYPRDWRGDQSLRAVSIAARGLWMEMLCIMHEASPYGHLVLGGQAVSNDVLSRMSGTGVDEVSALLIELESAGVLSRTRRGVIYSRRMVKDKSRSEKGRKAVTKRWSHDTENEEKNDVPNRSPNRSPITQKPEARMLAKASSAREVKENEIPPLMARLCRVAGMAVPDPGGNFARHSDYLEIVRAWVTAGADPPMLDRCIERRAASLGKPPGSLRYFDGAVRDEIAANDRDASWSDRKVAEILDRKRKAASTTRSVANGAREIGGA